MMLKNTKRRDFIKHGTQGLGLALLGGFSWSAYLSENKTKTNVLRPPGARNEAEFRTLCIKCGLCVVACPFGTLKLGKAGEDIIGEPYFTAREVPCKMCEDIPCVPVCPTGALDASLVSKDSKLDINMAKMGIAVVDNEHCLAYWGIRCEACYRACPLIGKAITIETKHNPNTGHHAYLLPIVDNNICTGCGQCETACITEKASITIIPRHIVSGKTQDRYVKVGGKIDENIKQKTKSRDSKSAMNYLNNEPK